MVMVALLAFGLAVENLAARDNAMLPLMWLHAVAPGLICGWLLLGPQWLAIDAAIPPRPRERMTPPVTLSIYIARQFTGCGGRHAARAVRAGGDCSISSNCCAVPPRSRTQRSALVSEIAALRLPYIAMQVLPFAVLLGGMLCFWRLTRSSELIVARAAGVSAWEFLAAPTLCALLFGALATCGDQPVIVGDVRARRGDGQHVSQDWRRPVGADRRPALAAPVRSRAVAAGRRDHPRARRGAARQAVDRLSGQRVPAGRA